MPTAELRADLTAPFDLRRFETARRPLFLDRFDGTGLPEGLRCLDMLIRRPGGELLLPPPYDQNAPLQTFIAQCAAFERRHLGLADGRFWYLTFDQGWVPPGNTQRVAGWHFDGMQGARWPQKVPPDFAFLWSNVLGTEFADGPFDIAGLDPARHNLFDAFGRQITAPDCAAPNSTVSLVSAYHVHRGQTWTGDVPVFRRFMRLQFSLRIFDRLENTDNPLLPVGPRFDRPIPAHLT